MEDKKFPLELPWTIEQQLKAYSDAAGHTERHEILRQSWSQNRRLIAQLLEFTLADFPNYSQHNETHCRSVIHNIECLLGEEEIHRLSPTDSFAILMTVYLHDLGMCITAEDRGHIIQSKAFADWIRKLEQSADPEYLNAVKTLKRVDYRFRETDHAAENKENYRGLYSQKLEVYYAISFLISEHQRKRHAEIAAERMSQWVEGSSGLRNGFSMTGIPERIFLLISQCAALHGISKLEDVMPLLMQLPKCDNGFAQDFYHPRFVAVLLMIGDALDIDNQRFHPFAREHAGKLFSRQSEMHYRKHRAIRALQITPERIYIRADCQDPSEMRLLRNEVNWLQQFIKECSYQWTKIAPGNFCGCLPVVDFERISLGGMPMNEQLVQAQFRLSQEKAFRLLEGASFYQDPYVYLREMLQNAADAIKFQYWNDLDSTDLDTTADIDLCRANETLPLHRYPINIYLALRKRWKKAPDQLEKIMAADLELSEQDLNQCEFGVEASVQDCGIGIGEEDLCAISKVGTSQEHRRDIIEKMPPWLRPTGRFGIGLQSLFQADNIFWCVTRTHRDECYKMTFNSGTRNEGYINVVPKDWREGERGGVHYGTRFTLFIPISRAPMAEGGLGQPKMDPFHKDYKKGAALRRAFQIMKQMEYYLDRQIGENLFPIKLKEEPLAPSLVKEGWGEWVKPLQVSPFQRLEYELEGVPPAKELLDGSGTNCWLFKQFTGQPSHKFLRGHLANETGSAYYLDVDSCKLYIWSQNAKCFFTCGTKRIIQAITPDERRKRNPEKTGEYGTKIRLFLKGLLVTDIKYAGNELIESIDIKNDALQPYLFMNRNALSPEGEEYVRREIIPPLHQTFRAVLQDINHKAIQQLESNRVWLKKHICNQYKTICAEFMPQDNQRGCNLLLKKLDALKLSDFVLIKNDFEWAIEESDWKRREQIDDVFHVKENRLFDCVAQADFSMLEKAGKEENGGNLILSSCRQRMKNDLYNQVNQWKEEELDCVSYLLNKLVTLSANIDERMRASSETRMLASLSEIENKIDRLMRMSKEERTFDFDDYLDLVLDINDLITINGEPHILAAATQLEKGFKHLLHLDRPPTYSILAELKNMVNELMSLSRKIPASADISELRQMVGQMREYVILYAMFFFYVNKEGLPGPSACAGTESDWCGWEYINHRISEALSQSQEVFQSFLNKSDVRIALYNNTLFVPGCREQPYGSLTSGGYSFAELMRNDRHFGVFSTRASHNDPWKHMLVRLCPLPSAYAEIEKEGSVVLPGVKAPTILDVLEHMPESQKECGSRWAFLEDWNAGFIEQMRRQWINPRNPNGESGRGSYRAVMDESVWGNELVRWIVRKLPSISVGADKTGNNRLNVLVRRALPHVFFDSRMISLMVARMKKQYAEHNDLRFSIPVWDGLDALRCGEIPPGVAEANRGVMPEANRSSRMLLVVGSELPSGCCKPEKDPFASRREKLPDGIRTSFDLLEQMKASYQSPEKEPIFAFPPVMRIFDEYKAILQMEPFRPGFQNSDMETVSKLQRYCAEYGIQIDSSLASRGSRVQKSIQAIYWSYFNDHVPNDSEIVQPTRYTEIDLPPDRQKFINTFLIDIFMPDRLGKEGSLAHLDIPHYSTREEFDSAVHRVYYAMDYCEMAPRDYRDTFLECACAWYRDEVWKKDPGTQTFLRLSQELCGGTVQELEALYMTQLRRLLCAMIIDNKPLFFQSDLLAAVQRMKKDRTRRYPQVKKE